MTPAEWKTICDQITDEMRAHTRAFVTAISTRTGSYPKLVGSGAYLLREGQGFLLTCEHVANQPNLEHQFWTSDKQLPIREAFTLKPDPIDAAWSTVPDEMWSGINHASKAIPYERFALKHSISDPEEVLFFRGFAGENAYYDWVDYHTPGSGYCSQEKREVQHDPRILEMLWEPEKATITSQTTQESREKMKFSDPAGFSGSLLWNTRFMECHRAGHAWDPGRAVVTGIVRRYDPDTKTVLALRVEHLRAALEGDLSS
ncbi:MAG: hypothetical protein JWP44_4166 [Mucilaginibacter sp.]|nr:hypothetical protein [Mucilaginibacter sp.]